MRFSLRNQHKIAEHYNKKMLKRMLDSLTEAFKDNKEVEEIVVEGEPYPMIMVSDVGHTVNELVFYIYRRKYDVLNLAFKEIIG